MAAKTSAATERALARIKAGETPYAAAKAGLVGLTKSVAAEVASRNVTANVVAPGFVTTDMTAALPESVQEHYLGKIPMGRMGSADEVAEQAQRLAREGLGYGFPLLADAADALETHGVRRIEFLAGKMPKVTQIGTTRLMPPEGAIRAWARMVAAADNPGEIEERVAHGTVTREDREVMQALYPERYAAFVRQVVEHPQDVAKLPYQNRLSLALFTGAPVDATLDPRILGAMQGVYAREPGTEGGTQAPRPQPAFGSVKAPEATPAERRAG